MESHLLLKRLDEIGQSLEQSSHALALIGLGSVGLELHRLDDYSDLDFFVIVEPGYKHTFINDLEWLSKLCPVAYCFLNSPDGYKLLFTDGIFCEFAVFEPDELREIPFAAGRVIWKQPHVSEAIGLPLKRSENHQKRDQNWLVGEALTNLYVGMGREKRGERLSATRFIQGYAVDRLMELVEFTEESQPVVRDEFSPERRFEQRYHKAGALLPTWMQGYERNRESALSILAFLESHFDVNEIMAKAVRALCK